MCNGCRACWLQTCKAFLNTVVAPKDYLLNRQACETFPKAAMQSCHKYDSAENSLSKPDHPGASRAFRFQQPCKSSCLPQWPIETCSTETRQFSVALQKGLLLTSMKCEYKPFLWWGEDYVYLCPVYWRVYYALRRHWRKWTKSMTCEFVCVWYLKDGLNKQGKQHRSVIAR